MQLKSTKSIKWTKNGTTKVYISKSTCNYWMQNIMPVLLFLADVSSDKVYYIDVKRQIRENYILFSTCENFSFTMNERCVLQKTPKFDSEKDNDEYFKNIIPFLGIIVTMNGYDSFLDSLKDFILNWKKYFEHIEHQGADPFLRQELDFYFMTQHINMLMLHISNTLRLSHCKVDFQKIRNDFLQAYKFWDVIPEFEVLEYEITAIHSQMQRNLPVIISGIKNYVLTLEKDYWQFCFSHIFKEAMAMELESPDY